MLNNKHQSSDKQAKRFAIYSIVMGILWLIFGATITSNTLLSRTMWALVGISSLLQGTSKLLYPHPSARYLMFLGYASIFLASVALVAHIYVFATSSMP